MVSYFDWIERESREADREALADRYERFLPHEPMEAPMDSLELAIEYVGETLETADSSPFVVENMARCDCVPTSYTDGTKHFWRLVKVEERYRGSAIPQIDATYRCD